MCRFSTYLKIKRWFYKHKFRVIARYMDRRIRIKFAFDFPSSVEYGKNVIFCHHGLGCVIHPRAKIGNNCKIYQNVSIGCRNNEGPPVIGDNVLIGAGACILGNVTIGNNCQIGANAVVIFDIPDNSVAVGVPAKIIKKNGE